MGREIYNQDGSHTTISDNVVYKNGSAVGTINNFGEFHSSDGKTGYYKDDYGAIHSTSDHSIIGYEHDNEYTANIYNNPTDKVSNSIGSGVSILKGPVWLYALIIMGILSILIFIVWCFVYGNGNLLETLSALALGIRSFLEVAVPIFIYFILKKIIKNRRLKK